MKFPPGSIPGVLDYLCDRGITSADNALTLEEIARDIGLSWHTVKYDLRALSLHLGLVEKDTGGAGGKVRYFVPFEVYRKTDILLPELGYFRGKKLRPGKKELDAFYEAKIRKFTSGRRERTKAVGKAGFEKYREIAVGELARLASITGPGAEAMAKDDIAFIEKIKRKYGFGVSYFEYVTDPWDGFLNALYLVVSAEIDSFEKPGITSSQIRSVHEIGPDCFIHEMTHSVDDVYELGILKDDIEDFFPGTDMARSISAFYSSYQERIRENSAWRILWGEMDVMLARNPRLIFPFIDGIVSSLEKISNERGEIRAYVEKISKELPGASDFYARKGKTSREHIQRVAESCEKFIFYSRQTDGACGRNTQILKKLKEFILSPAEDNSVDINASIEAEASVYADIPGFKIAVEYDPLLPKIRGHSLRISFLWINLLKNSFEAIYESSHNKSGNVSFRTRTVRAGGKVFAEIIYSDNGKGIDKKKWKDAVKKAERPVRSKNGRGMGLPIVCRTIAEHGGTVQVYGIPGKGTTFIMRFPAVERKTDEIAREIRADDEAVRYCIRVLLSAGIIFSKSLEEVRERIHEVFAKNKGNGLVPDRREMVAEALSASLDLVYPESYDKEALAAFLASGEGAASHGKASLPASESSADAARLLSGLEEGALMRIGIMDDSCPVYKEIMGLKIKLLMRKAGMNAEELAGLFKVSVTSVRNWERGKKIPSPEHMSKLVEILNGRLNGENVTVSLLVSGREEQDLLGVPVEDTFFGRKMFGLKLRALRYIKGITMVKAAAEAGVSKTALGTWESGRHMPYLKVVPGIARAYGVTLEDLTGTAGHKKNGGWKGYAAEVRASLAPDYTLAAITPEDKGTLEKKEEKENFIFPPGSIPGVFKFLCEKRVISKNKAVTAEEIGRGIGGYAYETVKYDLRALYYHLRLIEKADAARSGKDARYFVPEAVRIKWFAIMTELKVFNGKYLRPDTDFLENIYNGRIEPLFAGERLRETPERDTAHVPIYAEALAEHEYAARVKSLQRLAEDNMPLAALYTTRKTAGWFLPYWDEGDAFIRKAVRRCLVESSSYSMANFVFSAEEKNKLEEAIPLIVKHSDGEIIVKTFGIGPKAGELKETAVMIMEHARKMGKDVSIRLIGYDINADVMGSASNSMELFILTLDDLWKKKVKYEIYYGDIADRRYWEKMALRVPSDVNIWRHTWLGQEKSPDFSHKDRTDFTALLYGGLNVPGVLLFLESAQAPGTGQRLKRRSNAISYDAFIPEGNAAYRQEEDAFLRVARAFFALKGYVIEKRLEKTEGFFDSYAAKKCNTGDNVIITLPTPFSYEIDPAGFIKACASGRENVRYLEEKGISEHGLPVMPRLYETGIITKETLEEYCLLMFIADGDIEEKDLETYSGRGDLYGRLNGRIPRVYGKLFFDALNNDYPYYIAAFPGDNTMKSVAPEIEGSGEYGFFNMIEGFMRFVGALGDMHEKGLYHGNIFSEEIFCGKDIDGRVTFKAAGFNAISSSGATREKDIHDLLALARSFFWTTGREYIREAEEELKVFFLRKWDEDRIKREGLKEFARDIKRLRDKILIIRLNKARFGLVRDKDKETLRGVEMMPELFPELENDNRQSRWKRAVKVLWLLDEAVKGASCKGAFGRAEELENCLAEAEKIL
ncbi:MAG: helix-turn-helix domain-containing protein, partial [Candidatus Omnitrophota bacterium]